MMLEGWAWGLGWKVVEGAIVLVYGLWRGSGSGNPLGIGRRVSLGFRIDWLIVVDEG